jgi:anionic cell wall polymer biosynthesis LytR-Cps2A-Psr (LCP) family protein
MKNKHSSVDGFVPRRSGNQLGDLHSNNKNQAFFDVLENKKLHNNGDDDDIKVLGQSQIGGGLGRSDIDESLQGIDDIKEPVKKLSRRQRRRLEKQSVKKPKSLIRRIIKWFFILILLAGISVGGYMAYKFVSAGNSVFQGSIFEVFKNQPLKQDSNGRSNFLILGTSEDDPGHQGSNLTDSMLVLSVDQTNKNAYMFSVPRDMEVRYGMACVSGYSGKINAYFSCVSGGTTKDDEQDRLTKTQKLVGDIFGLDIQYGIHVNYTVMRDVVKALGNSITVTIESRNPNGQMDSNFDWKCGSTYSKRIKKCPPSGHYIDYPNGPVKLDAEHALYLAQARGDIAPTYGFEKSNFDREKNQQKILVAIRDKAMSAGTLTNLGSVSQLIDALGSNLRTNIQTNEIRTLMQVASEVKSSDIHTLSFIDGDSPLMGGDANPSAGLYNYTDIRAFIAKSLSNNQVLQESASTVVLNGTSQVGLGQTEAGKLTAKGFNVTLISNAPTNTYTATEVYQIGTGNSATAAKLASLYKTTVKTTTPPVTVTGDVNFVVIIGAASS